MQEHWVFKGATRPALFIGVPLVPMMLLSLATMMPLGWLMVLRFYKTSVLLLLLFLVGYVWMRGITKQDGWRTKQELLRMRLRRQKGNTRIWGGVSYCPLRLKRRADTLF
jgi:type IV secretion system protein VirB3